MSLRVSLTRVLLSAALGGLCLVLCKPTTVAAPVAPVDVAPEPRTAAADLDKALMDEIKNRSEIMKNLQYMSDVIGPRLTGSKALEKANNWTAEKMKSYGLENVRLEPWEIPVGWERGRATMKLIEPDNGRELTIASRAWTPGTNGKVTGNVIILRERTKEALEKYKCKLCGAVILQTPPAKVSPVTDLRYLGGGNPPPTKDEKKDESKAEIKKDGGQEPSDAADQQPPAQSKKDEQPPKKDEQPKRPFGGGGFGGFTPEITEFLKAEGVACTVTDAGKPHGLLNMTGNWPADRAEAEARLPSVFMVHEHYALLWRLASREGAFTKVETDIDCKFIPGP